MVDRPPPSEETDQYWIYAEPGDRKAYFETHGVLTPDETTGADLPDAEDPIVRELDEVALRRGTVRSLKGKWLVFVDPSDVDDRWACVTDLVDRNEVYSAKVSSKLAREREEQDQHVIVVYTPNYFDRDDVDRVRTRLREACGITDPLQYKPDLWSRIDIYEETASDLGLSDASRFSE